MYITEDCYLYKGTSRVFNQADGKIYPTIDALIESLVDDDFHDDMWKLFGPVWVEDISVLKADSYEFVRSR
jgi:hypothetical protein